MERKKTLKMLIITATGILFAGYAAYSVFIIFKDSSMTMQSKFISGVVALLFFLLACFAWTSGVKNIRFLAIRRMVLIGVLAALVVLKARMIAQVVAYLDPSDIPTLLYGGTYFLTLAVFLILFIYYTFIRKNLPLYPRMGVFLPALAIVLSVCSLALEAVLYFVYHIGLEPNPLRTMVIRPVFYLGLIGLSVYFLFPPRIFGAVEDPIDPDQYNQGQDFVI